jgi:hypothetical protein
VQPGWYDRTQRRVRDLPCGDLRISLDVEVRRVACRGCGTVKRERLAFLADNPFYTKRFAFYVGRRCRASPIRDVAKELRLDWHTVKALEEQYMREQLRRAGTPGPRVLGLDEISIKKGHTYRIVVSDLVRHRPIWFGGEDRSEASLDQFYTWLGARKAARIRLVVLPNSRMCGILNLRSAGIWTYRRAGSRAPRSSRASPARPGDRWIACLLAACSESWPWFAAASSSKYKQPVGQFSRPV